jgi:hypothetical protein
VGRTWYDDIWSIRTDGTDKKPLAVDSQLCVATKLGNVVWYKHGDSVYADIASVSSDVKHQVENFVGYPYGETSNGLIVAHGSPTAPEGLRLYVTLDGSNALYLSTSGPGVPDGNDRLQAVLF